MKVLAFFLSFQNEECILSVNKSEITGENAFNGDLFEIEDNHESSEDEKLGFAFFCRFVTSALTLRLGSTYIYLFLLNIIRLKKLQ